MKDEAEALAPYETELYGAPALAEASSAFGYNWGHRTYGIGAVKVECGESGIQSLVVIAAYECAHSSFKPTFSASPTDHWFDLMQDEFLTEICLREMRSDRITALSFLTNMRRSPWYGSPVGTIRKITAPAGFYIHSIHGSNGDKTCRNIGAYFVPLKLHERKLLRRMAWIANSDIVGSVPYDSKSSGSSSFAVGDPRAVMVDFAPGLSRVWCLKEVHYQHYFAQTDDPLPKNHYLCVLAKHELITALRACVTQDRISAIQFVTTLRTTEWLGPAPEPDAVIEERSIDDEPSATHIGGLLTMESDNCLKSITALFYYMED